MKLYNLKDLEKIEKPTKLIEKLDELESVLNNLYFEENDGGYKEASKNLEEFMASLPIEIAILEFFRHEPEGKGYRVDGGYLLIDEYDNYKCNRNLALIEDQVFIGDDSEVALISVINKLKGKIGHLSHRIDELIRYGE